MVRTSVLYYGRQIDYYGKSRDLVISSQPHSTCSNILYYYILDPDIDAAYDDDDGDSYTSIVKSLIPDCGESGHCAGAGPRLLFKGFCFLLT